MENGGKREGSGRKPGALNKKTKATIKACEESGVTPLAYMLSVMRDTANDVAMRMDAAHKAAPYIHAKLANIQPDGEGEEDNPTRELTTLEIIGTLELQTKAITA